MSWVCTIPEGYAAEIKDETIILKKKEPELTEFEKTVKRALDTAAVLGKPDNTYIKEISEELLERARDGFIPMGHIDPEGPLCVSGDGPCRCGDNRFEIIGKAKQDLLEATNIQDSPEEMAVINSFLFRCWQMGWLKEYETK